MHAALVLMRHARNGGGQTVLEQIATHLARAGHDVEIVCRTHEDAPHPRVRFTALRSRVIGPTWRLWQFARDVERHVERERYDVVVSLGRTWCHDVVRTGSGSQRTYLEQLGRFDSRFLPRVERALSFRDRAVLEIERRALSSGRLRKVIANSRMVMDDLVRTYGLPDSAFEVIHNAVDLERFHPQRNGKREDLRRSLGLEPGAFVLSFVGRGFARKGLERLLHALPEIVAARPRVHLVVAGNDAHAKRYRALASELGVLDRVGFVGECADPERLLAASDLHVVPTWYDSFAFTVLEALASGVPVLTTDAAGAAEIVERGVTGEVVPGACTSGELACALIGWCDPERVNAAREPARASAERHGVPETMRRFEDALVEAAPARV